MHRLSILLSCEISLQFSLWLFKPGRRVDIFIVRHHQSWYNKVERKFFCWTMKITFHVFKIIFIFIRRLKILSHNAWGEIQILFSGTAEGSPLSVCMQMTHNSYLMVFPLSWTVPRSIKLKLRVFLFLDCAKKNKSSCSISWNNVREKINLRFNERRKNSSPAVFSVVSSQQGEETNCSRNNQTTATKRCKEMLNETS